MNGAVDVEMGRRELGFEIAGRAEPTVLGH